MDSCLILNHSNGREFRDFIEFLSYLKSFETKKEFYWCCAPNLVGWFTNLREVYFEYGKRIYAKAIVESTKTGNFGQNDRRNNYNIEITISSIEYYYNNTKGNISFSIPVSKIDKTNYKYPARSGMKQIIDINSLNKLISEYKDVYQIAYDNEKNFREYLKDKEKKEYINNLTSSMKYDLDKMEVISEKLNFDYNNLFFYMSFEEFYKVKTSIDAVLTKKQYFEYKGNYTLVESYDRYYKYLKDIGNSILNDIDVDEIKPFVEGGQSTSQTVSYKRNPRAREECLRIKGYKCDACGFDFEKEYGERGKEYVEVHHLVSVTAHDGMEHEINPIEDLVPLCSNCHSMIHRRGLISVDELKAIIEEHKVV